MATWTLETATGVWGQEAVWYADLALFAGTAGGRQFYRSVDGLTWTFTLAPVGYEMYAHCYMGSGVFLASAQIDIGGGVFQQHILRSADAGVTWGAVAGPVTGGVLAYAPELGLAFVVDGTNVRSSPDGVTWTVVSTLALTPEFPYKLTWSGPLGLLCLLSRDPSADPFTLRTSADGVAWTVATLPPSVYFDIGIIPGYGSLKWSAALECFYLLVRHLNTGERSNRLLTSHDGTTWVLRSTMPNPDGVADGLNWWQTVVEVVPSTGAPYLMGVGVDAAGMADSATAQYVVRSNGINLDSWTLITPGVAGFSIADTIANITHFSPDLQRVVIGLFNEPQAVMAVDLALPITIDEIIPAEGDVTGGTTVEIIGSGFDPDVEIVFDHLFPQSLVRDSDTHLTAVTPAHALGPVTVTVNNPDGQFAEGPGLYAYVNADLPGDVPSIGWMGSGCSPSAIVPGHGTMLGGTPVAIYGSGFIPGSMVYFGGLPATDVVIAPDGTSITAVTPAHQTGAVDIEIVSP